jgi:hypothetical protein
MGRLDDPFFGFVPPIISYPPWWRAGGAPAMMQARPAPVDNGAGANNGRPGNGSPRAPGAHDSQGQATAGDWHAANVPPIKGQVEIRVDELGQVFLRGVVASEEARREIEETVRSVPGVTRVETQFQVQPRRESDDVPPPPEPVLAPSAPEPAPPPAPAIPRSPKAGTGSASPTALDSSELSRRIVAAIRRRGAAAELAVKVRSSDGVVTLSGPVPSAYEAMLVYRAAQQTPGVKQIVDQLEFPVPDEDHPNPLVQKGRPEDVEPYLASQIGRHLGDFAQLDRIQAHGSRLELRGSLRHPDDRDRLMAILRSMPLLSGFQIEPTFTSD